MILLVFIGLIVFMFSLILGIIIVVIAFIGYVFSFRLYVKKSNKREREVFNILEPFKIQFKSIFKIYRGILKNGELQYREDKLSLVLIPV